jgi:hypothetical protein
MSVLCCPLQSVRVDIWYRIVARSKACVWLIVRSVFREPCTYRHQKPFSFYIRGPCDFWVKVGFACCFSKAPVHSILVYTRYPTHKIYAHTIPSSISIWHIKVKKSGPPNLNTNGLAVHDLDERPIDGSVSGVHEQDERPIDGFMSAEWGVGCMHEQDERPIHGFVSLWGAAVPSQLSRILDCKTPPSNNSSTSTIYFALPHKSHCNTLKARLVLVGTTETPTRRLFPAHARCCGSHTYSSD